MRCTHAFLALAAVCPLAGATTWIVDVNNGPGTDFTQISSAIAAVSTGDTLLVRSGSYTAFVLDKPLSIIGLGIPGSPAVFQSATIQNLPAGSTTTVANFNSGGIAVLGNTGALMLDELSLGSVQVTTSADVRFRRLYTGSSMNCDFSRVEIADSTIVGHDGQLCMCCVFPHVGGPGQLALRVNGGEVHVARSTLIGGHGGGANCVDIGGCDTDGGAGGAGIVLLSTARLLLSGTADEFVQGGLGGTSTCTGGSNGAAGAAISMSAGCEARVSGETLIGGIANQGGTLTIASPDDPTLVALGSPIAGNIFTLRVHGPVGATADVILGRRPIIVGTPSLDEEQLAPQNRVFHLGPIPANGTVSLNYPVSPAWQPGFSVVFQGRVTLGPTAIYTNSVPAILQ